MAGCMDKVFDIKEERHRNEARGLGMPEGRLAMPVERGQHAADGGVARVEVALSARAEGARRSGVRTTGTKEGSTRQRNGFVCVVAHPLSMYAPSFAPRLR